MTLTRRTWSAHAIGLALCLAAFAFGYTQLAGRLPFGSALHESLIVPLFVGMVAPTSFVVGMLCVVLFFVGWESSNRRLLVGGYALFAVYWAALAVFSATLDF